MKNQTILPILTVDAALAMQAALVATVAAFAANGAQPVDAIAITDLPKAKAPKAAPKLKQLAYLLTLPILEQLAKTDARYGTLAVATAENLGGGKRDVRAALAYLRAEAADVSEGYVLAEANSLRRYL